MYPIGKYSNPGGNSRFPNTASPAFRTWSREQEKSVKFPIERGRCRVVLVMGWRRVVGRPFEMRVWRAVRVAF